MGIEGNFGTPKPTEVVDAERSLSREELRELREQQGYSDRLTEYITGLRLDDSRLVERLKNDQSIIRQKYNLPDSSLLQRSLSDYELELMRLAKKLGVDVRHKDEVGHFFEEHAYADAVHFEKDGVIANHMDRSERDAYITSLKRLEHELVHAAQTAKYPSMPIEAMEYEAYVANSNFDHLDELTDEERKESLGMFFGMMIGGSVNHWYSSTSTERGEKVTPVWDNAEYLHQLDTQRLTNQPQSPSS